MGICSRSNHSIPCDERVSFRVCIQDSVILLFYALFLLPSGIRAQTHILPFTHVGASTAGESDP